MRRTAVIRNEQKPMLTHDSGGTRLCFLLVGKKNHADAPSPCSWFSCVSSFFGLVMLSHPQAADPHARAPLFYT